MITFYMSVCLLVLSADIEKDPCRAMQDIIQKLENTTGYQCSTLNPCDTVKCVKDGSNLHLTLHRCNLPTALQVVSIAKDGHTEFNRTFVNSVNVTNATLNGVRVVMNVTIVHQPDLFGIRVSLSSSLSLHTLHTRT